MSDESSGFGQPPLSHNPPPGGRPLPEPRGEAQHAPVQDSPAHSPAQDSPAHQPDAQRGPSHQADTQRGQSHQPDVQRSQPTSHARGVDRHVPDQQRTQAVEHVVKQSRRGLKIAVGAGALAFAAALVLFVTRNDTQRAEPARTTAVAASSSAAPDATAGPVTTVSGDVGANGSSTFPFTVDATQVFYFAAAPDCTGSGLQWVVEDSAGTAVSVAAVMCGDIGRVSLPEGDYRVRVFADGTGDGGPFSFVREQSRDDRILTIASGQKVDGNIDLPGAQDIYMFSVTAGTVGYFASDECSASGPQWTIETDSGSPASGGAIICGDLGRVEFPDAGSFRMRVFSAGGTTGSYTLEWKRSRPDKTLAISSGQTVNGDLDLPGARDVLTFDVDAGEVAYFAGAHDCSANDRYWVVEDATDTAVSPTSGICDDIGRVAFAAAGSYHLRVVSIDGAIGAYAVSWLASRPDKVRRLSLGSGSSGAIDLPGSRDLWTFSAEEGQTVTFSAAADCTAMHLLWLVQATDGTAISPPNLVCSDLGAVTVPHTGEYQIVVSGDGDATGDYSFHTS